MNRKLALSLERKIAIRKMLRFARAENDVAQVSHLENLLRRATREYEAQITAIRSVYSQY